ncbi:hypothetical protein NT01EI_1054 [Edwardsiella ictaluri 93-146]|uniref:Uncharacterized protein n=1 Tax=Edwardsiella ictaluri (strain 93-146) TaxID=634503 RepID=C5BCH2_EDWI9|nr:hypothetical protein NT01EI_1054 [Edwardsiella ictaluri 93-146]
MNCCSRINQRQAERIFYLYAIKIMFIKVNIIGGVGGCQAIFSVAWAGGISLDR